MNWACLEVTSESLDCSEDLYCVGNTFLFGFDTNINTRGDVCNSLKVKSYSSICKDSQFIYFLSAKPL